MKILMKLILSSFFLLSYLREMPCGILTPVSLITHPDPTTSMRLLFLSRHALRANALVVTAAAIIVIAGAGSMAPGFAHQVQTPAISQQTQAPQASPAPTAEDVSDWHVVIDSGEKVITALAIIVGGFWAWLKFFRGRTFRSRVELLVSGNIITSGNNRFLKATMEMKNVGLSQVKFKKDAIYLDVFLIPAAKVTPAARLYNAQWDDPVTFEVFTDHGWIESSEEISDQIFLQLPAGEPLACKLKLTVNSRGNSWVLFETEGTRWSATTVVDCQSPTKDDDLSTQKKDKTHERATSTAEQLES